MHTNCANCSQLSPSGIGDFNDKMSTQVRAGGYYNHCQHKCFTPTALVSSSCLRLSSSLPSPLFNKTIKFESRNKHGIVVASSSTNASVPLWDAWKPEKASSSPSLSDILWPSAGAFAAMAILGKLDQVLAPKGLSTSIAPLGAVCAVLFAAPSSPAARKYNMFMAQIGCAAIGVMVFSILGPGWLSRSTALATSIAFMIYTRSNHPPAASLPLVFIDGSKFHKLNFWYALFPGFASCIVLSLLQVIVCYLKDNVKF